MSGGVSRGCLEKKLQLLRMELRIELSAQIESLREEIKTVKTALSTASVCRAQKSSATANPDATTCSDAHAAISAMNVTQAASPHDEDGLLPRCWEAEEAPKSLGQVVEQAMACHRIVPEPPELPPATVLEPAGIPPSLTPSSRVSPSNSRNKVLNKSATMVKNSLGRLANEAQTRIANEMERVNTVPVPFEDSAWNLVLVLGLAGASHFERGVSMIVFLFNLVLQLAFVWAVSHQYFLGEGLEEEIEAGLDWRTSFAHDAVYLDLRQTSLAARVCQQSYALNVASHQAELIEIVNTYLGLEPDEFESTGLTPGAMLSLACISLWFISMWAELRQIALVLQAIGQIPRKNKTVFREGEIQSIWRARAALFYLVGLLRLFLAFRLLTAGIIWLGVTTSIQDVILNAVALEAILAVDEIMFSALMPERVQNTVQCLDAVSVQLTSRRTFWECVVFFVSTFLVLILSYYMLIVDLVDQLVSVKQSICGGNKNFVMATNADTQLMFGHITREVSDDAEFTLQQKAVMSAIDVEDLNSQYSVGLLIFERILKAAPDEGREGTPWFQSLQHFKKRVNMDMAHLTSLELYTATAMCADYDDNKADNLSYDPMMAVAWNLLVEMDQYSQLTSGMQITSSVESCADLRQFCHEENARLIRLVCPVTCSCGVPNTVLMFRTTAHGCKQGCRRLAVEEGVCADNQMPYSMWSLFWDEWANHTDFYWGGVSGIEELVNYMKEYGCRGLLEIPTDLRGNLFCDGMDWYAPLTLMCPLTCGCDTKHAAGCPWSCQRGPTCADSRFLPSAVKAKTCEEARALGACSMQLSEHYCPLTCSTCPKNTSVRH